MERDYLDIIKEKEFIELNTAEREEVAELCATEEEFYVMKAMLLQIDGIHEASVEPKQKTKASLESLFAQTYPKATPMWYNSVFTVVIPKDKPVYRQPLAQIAAAFLIFWMVFPFFNEPLKQENKQVAKVEQKETDQQAKEINKTQPNNKAIENVTSIISQERKQNVKSPQEQPVITRSFGESTPVMAILESEISDAILNEDEAIVWEESTHPDGIFMASSDKSSVFTQSASETADLLDLLTATF